MSNVCLCEVETEAILRYYTNGSTIVNVEPKPSPSDFTVISPPMAWAIARATNSPKPVPIMLAKVALFQ